MLIRIVSVLCLCLLLAVASASAQSNNLLKNPTGAEGLQSWRVFGNASAAECPGAGKCFVIHQDAFIFQDVDVSEDAAGMFAVLIGLASIETNSDGPLGRPYLHGYFMSSGELRTSTIFANLTGQEMANQPRAGGDWVKQYGLFKVPSRTGRIRIFMRSGCGKTETSINCVSHFVKPGIFLFNTEDEARAFVNSYQ